MKNTSKIIYLVLSICFILGCSQTKTENQEEEKSAEHKEEPADQVGITEEQYKTIGIQLGKLEKRALTNTIKANGVLEVPPQNKATVTSYIGGIIKGIRVIQGDYVKKGQTLAVLEHPDILQLQQDYVNVHSSYTYQEKEFERQKELLKENVTAAKKFQQVESEYKTQRAMVSSLQGRLKLMGISPAAVENGSMVSSIALSSPINGFVDKILVNTGSSVAPANPIFEITDNSFIHVDLQVFEKDLSKVKSGQKINFTLANMDGPPLEAIIFAESKSLEANTKSITIHAEISGNKRKDLKPGMYVSGRIVMDGNTVPALPDDAIVAEGELKYIYIKTKNHHDEESKEIHADDKNKEIEEHEGHKEEKEQHEHEEAAFTFQRLEINTGIVDAGYTEILPISKIPSGAEIVTKGAYYLSAQLKKGEGGEEEGHGH